MILFVIFSCLIRLVPGCVLCLLAFRNHLRMSFGKTVWVLAGIILLITGSSLLMYSPLNPFAHWAPVYSLFCVALSAVLATRLLDGSLLQLFFLIFIFRSYDNGLGLFGEALNNLCFSKIDCLYLDQPGLFLGRLFMLLISFPFLVLFTTKFLCPLIDANSKMPFWRYLWMVPSFFSIIYHFGILPPYQEQAISFEVNPMKMLLPFIWVIGTFLTYFIIVQMLLETSKNAKLQEKLHVSTLQLAMQKELYNMVQINIEQTQHTRHDLRHHLLAIKAYADAKDSEKAEEYLANLLKTLDGENGPSVCDNYAVDAILRHYLNLARKYEISTSTDVLLPKDLPVPESDMSIILGNLIENAVQACIKQTSGERFIRTKVRIVGTKMVAISIKNSYSGEVNRQGENFSSSKRQGEGIGIASVRNVVEQYRGVLKFAYADGIFQVSVLLNP